ncbi:MAG: hypothetical protein LBK07_09820, partial [Tannerella sp.]|nr:hypothetical protein [Tannerella sp.]
SGNLAGISGRLATMSGNLAGISGRANGHFGIISYFRNAFRSNFRVRQSDSKTANAWQDYIFMFLFALDGVHIVISFPGRI